MRKSIRLVVAALSATLYIFSAHAVDSPDDYDYTPMVEEGKAWHYTVCMNWWIGKDVDMTYTTSGSGAVSRKAFELLKSLGFKIPSDYSVYNIVSIAKYLTNNHIIYLRGSGHAWICDACSYCIDTPNNPKPSTIYLHCDWGWGGNGNGYFSGTVFNVNSTDFKPANYFAVKREL